MQKIMIVEDDEVISSILKQHLNKWNYDVYVVENFENIVEDFIQQQPMLVLLDISLLFIMVTIGVKKSEKYQKFLLFLYLL